MIPLIRQFLCLHFHLLDSFSDTTSVFKDSPRIAAFISSSKSLDVNAGDPGGVLGGEQLMGSGELENEVS